MKTEYLRHKLICAQVTILHQISCTKLLRFRIKFLYDFAPYLLRFCLWLGHQERHFQLHLRVRPSHSCCLREEQWHIMISLNLQWDQPIEELNEDGQVQEFVIMYHGLQAFQGFHPIQGHRLRLRSMRERLKGRKLLSLWFRVKSSRSRMPTIIEDQDSSIPLHVNVRKCYFIPDLCQNRQLVSDMNDFAESGTHIIMLIRWQTLCESGWYPDIFVLTLQNIRIKHNLWLFSFLGLYDFDFQKLIFVKWISKN